VIPLALVNWHSCFFALFAVLACFFAMAVVATSNVVRMAFYLTLSLGATAGLFFLAGSEFVGAMQFMIYVGGTLVLLVFGVMLTAQGNFISMKTAAGEWVVSGALGAALLVLLVRAGLSVESWTTPRDRTQLTAADLESTGALGLGLVGVRVDRLEESNARLRAGLSGYLLPFVVVSMHLLVVLVGAGYMARTKTRSRGRAGALSATQAREHGPMPFMIVAGIVSGMAVNALLAAKCFFVSQWLPLLSNVGEAGTALASKIQACPPWLMPALALLFLANVLCLGIVWGWQKWGVFGLVALPVVQGLLISNSSLGVVPGVILAVFLLAPVGLIIALLLQGGNQSVWSQME
jgi:NADH:ubiquinone oxidoreductase subunit 6 (subunit J)